MEFKLLCGDAIGMLRTLPDRSINCCVTSPPYYGLRDYGTGIWIGGDPECSHTRNKVGSHSTTGHANMGTAGDAIYRTVCPKCGAVRVDNQLGLEETPQEYIDKLVEVFREVKRVLRDDGILWVNIGDTYVSKRGDRIKPKDLIGIPWMLAFALRDDGWYLRQDIIWAKNNPMPESVKDRCTRSHEYIFMLSKNRKYYFDREGIQEPANTYDNNKRDRDHTKLNNTPGRTRMAGLTRNDYKTRNKRDVWQGTEDDYANSKFSDPNQESAIRKGFNKHRGMGMVAIRKNLPEHRRFVKFLKQRTSIDDLIAKYPLERTKVEHWFRQGDIGFSYPSVEDWTLIRDSVNDGSNEFNDIDGMLLDVSYESDASDKNFEGMRNKRDVWRTSVAITKEAHFAVFPKELIEPCILAGCPEDGWVLDPFSGSGTSGIVAVNNNRNYIGIDLNPEYNEIAKRRIEKECTNVSIVDVEQ